MVELRLKWDKKEDVGWNTEKLRSRPGIMGVGEAALGMVLISDGYRETQIQIRDNGRRKSGVGDGFDIRWNT